MSIATKTASRVERDMDASLRWHDVEYLKEDS